MCGRFGLTKSPWPLADRLGIAVRSREWRPRYNIAPTQPVLAALNEGPAGIVDELRWGLVPSWSAGPGSITLSTINARIESVGTARTYRAAFRERRCAVFASGYYEWRKDADGGKTPMWIAHPDAEPFLFAGIWEAWRSRETGVVTRSCSIITQDADLSIAAIHTRMPVVLEEGAVHEWLSPANEDPTYLHELLARPSHEYHGLRTPSTAGSETSATTTPINRRGRSAGAVADPLTNRRLPCRYATRSARADELRTRANSGSTIARGTEKKPSAPRRGIGRSNTSTSSSSQ